MAHTDSLDETQPRRLGTFITSLPRQTQLCPCWLEEQF